MQLRLLNPDKLKGDSLPELVLRRFVLGVRLVALAGEADDVDEVWEDLEVPGDALLSDDRTAD